jgi:adenine-specific DNA-methyltransferase
MLTQYEKFKDILREMFQMDKSDLDFGIYRIMNARRDEIEKFLDKDLLPQVKEEFSKYRGTEIDEKKKELALLESTLRDSGMNPDDSPKVLYIREAISKYGDDEALTNEVFSHLTSFFRRYYDNGDFMSLRRYKKDTYAIPYEGEEVKLHWANADQYYIKTSEYLKDYTFKLGGGKRGHFMLVEATQEKDNIKAATGKERRFMLYDVEPIRVEDQDVYIQFVYLPDKEKQETHNKKTIEFINGEVGKRLKGFPELFAPAPTAKNSDRTIWEKHLNAYTARFNFDFFIHKDLGGFLRRELDFYIKNEVLFVDDLDANDERQLKSTVAKIKVIKHIGQKIITFLAQLEDFQKKLWLKKKFVVNCGYCVTLDRVPEALYPEIANNEAQREEWVKLFAIDEIEANLIKPGYTRPLTVEFLKANPYLVLDTKHFGNEFKDRLLASFDNLDEAIDGLIINSENFQALNLLLEKYHKQIDCLYTDPPYNRGDDGFVYKDSYRHSSWMSMLNDRLLSVKNFFTDNCLTGLSIDFSEQPRLRMLLESIFPETFVIEVANVNNPQGRSDDEHIATAHESIIVHANFQCKTHGWRAEENVTKRYRMEDGDGKYRETDLRKTGKNDRRIDRPNLFYYFYFNQETNHLYASREDKKEEGYIQIMPIRPDGSEGNWRWELSNAEKNINRLVAKPMERRTVWTVYEKDYLEQDPRVNHLVFGIKQYLIAILLQIGLKI